MSDRYEVFISFKNTDKFGRKTRDAEMAEELYHALAGKNIPAFYSNISIQKTAGAKFAQAIDKALEQCSILVAVGTSKENLESTWVYDEIDTFRNEMLNGNKPEGKSAIISYISRGFPHNKLPLVLRKCQSYYDLDQLVQFIVNHRNKENNFQERTVEPAHSQSAEAVYPEYGSKVLDRYRILRRIGRGGTSVVFSAEDEQNGKLVAVKAVRYSGKNFSDEQYREMMAEAELLKRLEHPAIPRIYDIETIDDGFNVVMELMEGQTLDQYLQKHKKMAEATAISIARKLGEVLLYLHGQERPIIYRDMKPANIVMKNEGGVALLDFGIAREYKEGASADTACLGTIGYAAPEQFGGMGQTDGRTDIYALGVTLNYLVTGMNPASPPYQILPVREVDPTLSRGLEYIIEKCTQKDPEKRYQSAKDFLNALDLLDKAKRRPAFEWVYFPRSKKKGKAAVRTDKKKVSGAIPSAAFVPPPPSRPVAVGGNKGFTVPGNVPASAVPMGSSFVPRQGQKEFLGDTCVLGAVADDNMTLMLTEQARNKAAEKEPHWDPQSWTGGSISVCVCTAEEGHRHALRIYADEKDPEELKQSAEEIADNCAVFTLGRFPVEAGQLFSVTVGSESADGDGAVHFFWMGRPCYGIKELSEPLADNGAIAVWTKGNRVLPEDKAVEKSNEAMRELEAVILKLKGVRAILCDRVFGQDEAVDKLVDCCLRAELSRKLNKRSEGIDHVCLLTGPIGAGKAYTAECIAQITKRPCKRIRLEDQADPAMGSEDVLRRDAAEIAEFVKNEPECMLIFDGIEHATPAMLRLAVRLLDKGIIKEGEYEASAKDAFAVFIANIAANDDKAGKDNAVPAVIERRISHENVIRFRELSADCLQNIVKRELLSCAADIGREYGVGVEFDKKVSAALLCTEGGTANAGVAYTLARSFFFDEVSALLISMGTPEMQGNISDLECLRIALDESGADEDVLLALSGEKLAEGKRLVFLTDRSLDGHGKTALIRLHGLKMIPVE